VYSEALSGSRTAHNSCEVQGTEMSRWYANPHGFSAAGMYAGRQHLAGLRGLHQQPRPGALLLGHQVMVDPASSQQRRDRDPLWTCICRISLKETSISMFVQSCRRCSDAAVLLADL